MSVCTTTGLSKDQQERWPHLYKHLIEEIEIPDLANIDLAAVSYTHLTLPTIE